MAPDSNPQVANGALDPSVCSRLTEKLSAIELEISGLFDRVPFGSHTEAADGTFLSVNALELAWLGYASAELIGKRKLIDFLTPHSREIYLRYRPQHGAALSISNLHLEIVRRNGTSMPVTLSSLLEQNSKVPLLNNRFMLFDLSEMHKADGGQAISTAVFDSLSGMCITNHDGIIQQVNAAFTTITGYSAAEAIGQSPRILSSGHHGKTFYEALWDSVLTTGRWQGEIWNRRKNGEIYVEWLSISTVVDMTGSATHYVGSFTDITAARNVQSQLSHMAYYDGLTQLSNRRLFLDRLSQTLSNSRRSHLFNAILYLDLDGFKAVNDTCGHDAGDLVLIEVAQRLRHAVREGDGVARLSGDEFAILLENLDADRLEAATKARQLGEKILTLLSQKHTVGTRHFYCTASIGVELFKDADSASELLRHADLAMYQSKSAGRNTLKFFDQTMQDAIDARANLEADLRKALEEHQLRLHFQPQFNHQGALIGVEALLRWQHPERGLIHPLEFAPLAEETRLSLPIGSWVFKTACEQLKTWERHPVASRIQLAVNVSPLQFHQNDFVAQLAALVAASAINPHRLTLEITEGMILHIDDAVSKMAALAEMGVRFSIDDFGTGLSSLLVLSKLPLAQLKIDQSFVQNMECSARDGVIVQTITAMAHTLGLEVIADGVETQDQRAFLEKNGCKNFQGHLFSQALPIEALEKLLSIAQ